MLVSEIVKTLKTRKDRSAWGRGVMQYALELLVDVSGDYDMRNCPADEKLLLNGADDWKHYSYSGCSFVYDEAIAERLCSPSELKKTNNGEHNPNKNESWLDVQSRALFQAARLIEETINSNS